MRLQGGTRGIICAIEAGRLDPLDAWLPDEYRVPGLTNADRRALARRDRARRKRLAARLPF